MQLRKTHQDPSKVDHIHLVKYPAWISTIIVSRGSDHRSCLVSCLARGLHPRNVQWSRDVCHVSRVRLFMMTRGDNGPHGGSIETTGHWAHWSLVLPVVSCPPSLPVQIQLCNRHKVATRRFITLFIFHCSMPRQQQLCALWQGQTWHSGDLPSCHHTGGPRAQSGETQPQHCQHPHHGHHGH